ncbi:MAG: hypothetical protein K0S75_367 [Clostridia bacterium]|jgi:hypothetical protein|nr:hypothetical protein [Clostridia bacterium]
MSIHGIGAYYDDDVSSSFITESCACIGYGKSEASSLYEMLRRIKIGDIIYIKSYQPTTHTVFIKAIGFVTGKNVKEYNFPGSNESMGYGRKVSWKRIYTTKDEWIRIQLPQEDMKNNVYNNTLYEEYSFSIIEKLLDQF